MYEALAIMLKIINIEAKLNKMQKKLTKEIRLARINVNKQTLTHIQRIQNRRNRQ